MKILAVLALLIAVAGCANPIALSPSELNTNAAKYEGRHVRIRGWLIIRPHFYAIWDSQTSEATSPSSDIMPPQCVSWLGKLNYNDPNGEYVTLWGTYWKNFAESLNVVDLGSCNWSGFEPDFK